MNESPRRLVERVGSEAGTRSAFPRWLMLMLVATGTLVIGSAFMMIVQPGRNRVPQGQVPLATQGRSPLTPDEGLEDLAIPAFALVNQNGEPVDQRLFEGEVTIVDFAFTNCPFVCPGMTAAMLRLQSDLAGTGVRLATISVDPVHDTPDVLMTHTTKLGVDTTRWPWMTGDESTIKKIVSESLKFELQEDPANPIDLGDGRRMNNIMHPSRLFLIGPDRSVLGFYSYTDPASLEALKSRAIAGVRSLRGR
jgi:cytochrome oxidase Cu insertion factor (SCO1/SenC/PrrC family)